MDTRIYRRQVLSHTRIESEYHILNSPDFRYKQLGGTDPSNMLTNLSCRSGNARIFSICRERAGLMSLP